MLWRLNEFGLKAQCWRTSTWIVCFAIVLGTTFLGVEAHAETKSPTSYREFNIFPVIGGDSDVGMGLGEVSSWARVAPGDPPYSWRLESGAFITFKRRTELIVPFQDYYLVFSIPNLGKSDRWRLDIRPAFTNETTLIYYGLGNASILPKERFGRALEYGRVHPTLKIQARAKLTPNWYVLLGSVYTHSWLTIRENSILAEEQALGSPATKRLLGSFASHGVELFELGMEYDSRDNEIVTKEGVYHGITARLSPAINSVLPYGYAQLNATARFYTTPIPRRLTLSFRSVIDVLLGSPPFYELARSNESPAIGGGKAVRGIPAHRYYGKVKVFGNIQILSDITEFKIRKKPFVLGTVLFFDAGRIWTELFQDHSSLDGSGTGLKYGMGGGLRLQLGKTFIVRADLAWSPDASPVGGYFTAAEIF